MSRQLRNKLWCFFFPAEDGIRDYDVTGVQTCALPIYAMAKIRFWGRNASIYTILTTRVIPDIALVVPFFLVIKNLGLLDHVGSLIITYLAITVPFTVFILVSYFESIPDELDKAARVDGCSRLQTLIKVFLPLSVPSLVAVILFA